MKTSVMFVLFKPLTVTRKQRYTWFNNAYQICYCTSPIQQEHHTILFSLFGTSSCSRIVGLSCGKCTLHNKNIRREDFWGYPSIIDHLPYCWWILFIVWGLNQLYLLSVPLRPYHTARIHCSFYSWGERKPHSEVNFLRATTIRVQRK